MRFLSVLCLLACLLLATGCRSDGDQNNVDDPSDTVSFSVGDPQPVPEPVPQAAAGLFDRTWKLVELGGKPAAFPNATLRFDRRDALGYSGCNRIDATLTQSATALNFRRLAMTERGCDRPGIHAFETAYAEALSGVRRWEIRAGQLVLTGRGASLVFDPP